MGEGANEAWTMPLDEPITPELALVCPELAERARAELPDRPWEAFLPRPQEAPARARGPADAGPEAASPPVARVDRERRRQLLPTVTLVVLLALVAALAASGLPPLRDAPSLPGGGGSPRPPLAVPEASYRFDPRGHFIVDRTGGAILEFRALLPCGGVRLLNVPIARDGSFAGEGETSSGVPVRLSGRFAEDGTVVAHLRSSAPGCRRDIAASAS